MTGRVLTRYGHGQIIKQEGLEGVLSERYLVKVDDLSRHPALQDMQCKQGGLYFHVSEIKKPEEKL